LPSLLERYATRCGFEFHQYSPFHLRLIDQDFTVIDCWTTGKYYVKQTNYNLQTTKRIIERGGEKGWLPSDNKLEQWLDKLFYAADMEEVR
jgi:hypothetical protein